MEPCPRKEMVEPGFMRDVKELIEDFAKGDSLSFDTFRALWSARYFSVIHEGKPREMEQRAYFQVLCSIALSFLNEALSLGHRVGAVDRSTQRAVSQLSRLEREAEAKVTAARQKLFEGIDLEEHLQEPVVDEFSLKVLEETTEAYESASGGLTSAAGGLHSRAVKDVKQQLQQWEMKRQQRLRKKGGETEEDQ